MWGGNLLPRAGWWSRGLAVIAVLLFTVAGEARAHTHLTGSFPAADTTLGMSPRQIRLTFNEPVQLAFTRIRLIAADGREIALGAARIDAGDPLTVLAPVPLELLPGSYRVRWQAGSRDGHLVTGEIPFEVAPPRGGDGADADAGEVRPGESGTAGGPGAAGAPDGGALAGARPIAPGERLGRASPASRVARWVEFASLLSLVGVAAFVMLMLRRLGSFSDAERHAMQRRARVLGIVAAAMLLAMAVTRLLAEANAVAGGDGSVVLDLDVAARIALESTWGWGWIVGVVGGGLALAGFIIAAGRVASGWRVAAMGAAIAAVSPALTGHAIGSGSLAPVAVVADYVHVLAAGVWLGALVSVVFAAIPAALARPSGERAPAAASLIHGFHPLGLWGVTFLVASGVVSTWIRVRSVDALTTTNYGEILLFKIYVFLFAAVLGAYNFRRLMPRMRADSDAKKFRTAASVELIVGLTALALTAILVAIASPA